LVLLEHTQRHTSQVDQAQKSLRSI
jgi:hypothetical protein